MLQLLRKYQSYIFSVIAFVIIISFSFFGTYNTIPADSIHEQVVTTAIDGSEIKRSEVEEIALFISSDNEDKWLFGGIWGPNFLNDGVIKNDFLATGLAEVLVTAYPQDISSDLDSRLAKEKRFSLYRHPQAGFLSVESVWMHFAPEMQAYLSTLKHSDSATTPDAFAARSSLFLGERRFPAPMIRQVLNYQQKQYNWIPVDPDFNRTDLSLFGYHTVEDWFGPRFIRLVSEFIINSSKIAEQKGYKVSKAEAMADLYRNAEASYQQNIKNPHLGVTNSQEYLNEQLRRLNMDQSKAVSIWRQVLLFRRLFQDVGNAVVTDALTHQQFLNYAKESVSGDLYRLPQGLRFANYRTLQKFEVYLDAISKRSQKDLNMPSMFLTLEEVKKKFPELVQKRYVLQIAQVQKNALQTKVGLKEMWNWEADNQNWKTLVSQFPELGVKGGESREQRFATLDSLDNETRSKIDTFARAAIVNEHAEWLQQALQDAEAKNSLIGISATGGNSFVKGLTNRTQLLALLDQAPLADKAAATPQEENAAKQLSQFTADGQTYYRITVLDRTPTEEILTFANANKDGLLDSILDKQLEAYHLKVRESHPKVFLKEDKTWKAFADVKDQVADLYFATVLQEIQKDYTAAKGINGKKQLTGDQSASVRFFAHTRRLKDLAHQGLANVWITDTSKKDANDVLEQGSDLSDQWKLEQTAFQSERSADNKDIEKEPFFALAPQEWSEIHTPINGDIQFFQMKSKDLLEDTTTAYDQTHQAHQILSNDAQRHYMQRVTEEIKSKNAISLRYLNPQSQESMESIQ